MPYIKISGMSKEKVCEIGEDLINIVSEEAQATADRIIKYRKENGNEECFKCIDDIKKVPGIKELTFNKIRDYIKL